MVPLWRRKEFWHTEKGPRNCSVWHFSSNLDVPKILKIRDGILAYRKRPSKLLVARILVFKIRPSQEILKIRDGTPLEAEEILTYRKKPSKRIIVQKNSVARILVFKIRSSQEILKIRDGTPLEAEGILTYRKKPSKLIEILKICDGTPLEAEGILAYRKRPSKLLGHLKKF
ncbi:hypothetical protein OROHE_019911 [Orobanche hederae]